jgi:hypothetical protein
MLTSPPRQIGRFLELTTPNGDVVYKEQRGDSHYYHAEIKQSSSAKGGYSFVKGSTLTGVSTAAKFLDGDPTRLLHWAAGMDQAGIARIYNREIESGQYAFDWLRSPESIAQRLREEEATWEHERNRRASQGTNVHHHTVWKLATGQDADLADLSEAERGFGQGVFASFLGLDLLDKVVYAEQLTVSHATRIAGTFDVLAGGVDVDLLLEHLINPKAVPEGVILKGQVTLLIDYKTRDQPGKVRKSDHVQLQGYEDCNRSCGIGPSDGQVVIVVLPDGTFEPYWCEATPGAWAAAVNACHSARPLDSRIAAMCKAAKTAREAVVA